MLEHSPSTPCPLIDPDCTWLTTASVTRAEESEVMHLVISENERYACAKLVPYVEHTTDRFPLCRYCGLIYVFAYLLLELVRC